MRGIVRWCLAIAMATALSACASMPTAAEQQAADYGADVDQATAERLAEAFLRRRLKDPMSAVYEWQAVHRGFVGNAPLLGRKAQFGYVLEGSVNAKNSFGGYTGAKSYQFLIRNGAIAYAMGEECLSGGGCYMAPIN
jgi:hypothetical protein